MITQIKLNQLNIQEEKIITLEVHPRIRSKMRTQKKYSQQFSCRDTVRHKQNQVNCQVNDSFHKIEFKPPETIRKAESYFIPRKTLKTSRMSSYQLYKEQQKKSKLYQREKAVQWKRNIMTISSNRKSMREYKSLVYSRPPSQEKQMSRESPTKTPLKLLTQKKLDLHPVESTLSPKMRSVYVRTNDGKRKFRDNKKYLDRIKHTLQANYYSTIRGSRANLGSLEPQIMSLSPKGKQQSQKNVNQENPSPRRKFLLSKSKPVKQKKSINIDGFSACRPWSGNKIDPGIISDIATLLSAH